MQDVNSAHIWREFQSFAGTASIAQSPFVQKLEWRTNTVDLRFLLCYMMAVALKFRQVPDHASKCDYQDLEYFKPFMNILREVKRGFILNKVNRCIYNHKIGSLCNRLELTILCSKKQFTYCRKFEIHTKTLS